MHRDPLLDALIGKLPPPGEVWPQSDRDTWLGLMRSVFDLVYGRDGQPAPPAPVIDLPKLPLRGDDAPPERLRGEWHVDAEGAARAPDGDEAQLEAVPRGTVLLDLRPESDGRLDTVIWADGTYPAQQITSRGLRLRAKAA